MIMNSLTYDYDITIRVCYNKNNKHHYLYFQLDKDFIFIPIRKNNALKIQKFLTDNYEL